MEGVRWSLLRRLRCPPPAQSYGQANDAASEYTVSDIRSFHDSELDGFIRHRVSDVGLYQKIALKLFLAQRFAFGLPALVTAADWLLRASMLLIAMVYSSHATAIDVFRPKELGVDDVLPSSALLALANSVHIWSLIKG